MDADGSQGVFDLVGHAGGQGGQGGQALGPPQAGLLGPLLRDVLDMDHVALDRPLAHQGHDGQRQGAHEALGQGELPVDHLVQARKGASEEGGDLAVADALPEHPFGRVPNVEGQHALRGLVDQQDPVLLVGDHHSVAHGLQHHLLQLALHGHVLQQDADLGVVHLVDDGQRALQEFSQLALLRPSSSDSRLSSGLWL